MEKESRYMEVSFPIMFSVYQSTNSSYLRINQDKRSKSPETNSMTRKVFKQAFYLWATGTPNLRFQEVTGSVKANINLGFYTVEHGCGTKLGALLIIV